MMNLFLCVTAERRVFPVLLAVTCLLSLAAANPAAVSKQNTDSRAPAAKVRHVLDKHPDSYFFYVRDGVRLLPLADKGIDGATVKPTRLTGERPAPRIAFDTESAPADTAVMAATDIPLELQEEAGVPRSAARIRVGVPLPRYGLFSLANLQVLNPGGQEVPAQFSVLSRWPDRSFKYVLVQFSAPLKAGEKAVYTLRAGRGVRHRARARLKLLDSPETLRVESDCLTAEIDKKKFNFLKTISVNGNTVGNFSPEGLVMIDEHGRRFTSAAIPPDAVTVEEFGAERAVIRVDGKLAPINSGETLRYTARLFFMTKTPLVQLQITVVDAMLKHEFFDLNELFVQFQTAFHAKTLNAGIDGHKPVQGKLFRNFDEKSIQVDARTLGHRPLGWFELAESRKRRVNFAVCNMAYRWPKGVALQGNTVKIELLPPLPGRDFGLKLPQHLAFPFCEGKHRLRWGLAFTENLFFDFGGNLPSALPAAESDFPVIAVIPPSWYSTAGVLPGIDLPEPQLDTRYAEMLKNMLAARDTDREYGYSNYGDWFGERMRNWGNNEYDTAHGYFTAFIRTGNREFYRLGAAAARHQGDVDLLHAYGDPRYVGGNFVHGIGHSGSSDLPVAYWSYSVKAGGSVTARNGHTWVRGMLDFWQLRGDARVGDCALLAGEQILRQARMHKKTEAQIRRTSWPQIALCNLYSVFPDPVYLCGAAKYTDMHVKAQHATGGWPRQVARLGGAEGDVAFMIGLTAYAQCRYHELTGDPAAAASLIAAARRISSVYDRNTRGIPYDFSTDLSKKNFQTMHFCSFLASSLAYAALMTDDAELHRTAIELFELELSRGFNVKKDMSIVLAMQADLLKWLDQWYRRHPERQPPRYDREKFTGAYISRISPEFRARGVDRKTFKIVNSGGGSIQIERNILKNHEVEITLTDARGNNLFTARGEAEKNAWSIPIPSDAGSVLTLTIEDNNQSFWNVKTTSGTPVFLKLAGDTRFRRPNFRRYYFTVPAGTRSFAVRLVPNHHGFIQGVIRRPDGTVAAEGQGGKFAVSKSEPGKQAAIATRIEVAPTAAETAGDAIWSIDFAVLIDGGIDFEGIPPYVSTVPALLPKALREDTAQSDHDLSAWFTPEVVKKAAATPARYAGDKILGKTVRGDLRILRGEISGSRSDARNRMQRLRSAIMTGMNWPQPAKVKIAKVKSTFHSESAIPTEIWSAATTIHGVYPIGQLERLKGDGSVWKLAHDNQFLYFSGSFIDSDVKGESVTPWAGDGLELFFWSPGGENRYSELIISVGLGITLNQTYDYDLAGWRRKVNAEIEGVVVQDRITKFGFTIEAAVPMRAFRRDADGAIRFAVIRCSNEKSRQFLPFPLFYSAHNIFGFFSGKLDGESIHPDEFSRRWSMSPNS